MKRKINFVIILSMISFVIIGYLLSDDFYYKKVLRDNQLKSSDEVFNWVSKHYINHGCIITHPYSSPRHLMENHKRLWCDEGAMVAAILISNLGKDTELVDMYGYDNISHHTILRVFENNKWVNYDFSFKLIGKDYTSSAKAGKIKLKEVKTRPYPKLYNKFVNVNFFLKKIIFFIRGIDENDFVE